MWLSLTSAEPHLSPSPRSKRTFLPRIVDSGDRPVASDGPVGRSAKRTAEKRSTGTSTA